MLEHAEPDVSPGLLTWCEIWCDVENSKSFRSSRDRRIFPGHRLKGASALHNFLASIFTAPSVTTWSDMSGNARKNQVTGLVTLRHRSTMSGALARMNDWREQQRNRDRERREEVMGLPVLRVRHHGVIDGRDGDVLVCASVGPPAKRWRYGQHRTAWRR